MRDISNFMLLLWWRVLWSRKEYILSLYQEVIDSPFLWNRLGKICLDPRKPHIQATLVIRVLQILFLLILSLLGMLIFLSWFHLKSLTFNLHWIFFLTHALSGRLMLYLYFWRYRVFLGHKQYFVSSDVGGGKMQWYAFHNEAPGGIDAPNGI